VITSRPVLVVDDDDSVRRSLQRLFLSAGFEVRTYASGPDLLEAQSAGEGGCLVLDLEMPLMTGLELQRELVRRGIELPIVFLSGHGTVSATVEAMKDGAIDFLEKPASPDDLVETVARALARGEQDREARERLAETVRRLATLTPREHQVYELVVAGRLNKQIARSLGASEKTIKVHRGRVMTKMAAESLAHLVKMSEQLARDG
jgi:FixJ family two-component response regulator